MLCNEFEEDDSDSFAPPNNESTRASTSARCVELDAELDAEFQAELHVRRRLDAE